MTGSRWTSPITQTAPYLPGLVSWGVGFCVAGVGLLAGLYIVADRTIPIVTDDVVEVEELIIALGAPAQRLEPLPPELIPDELPDEPPPPQKKTERSEEAPPPEPPPERRYFPQVEAALGPLSSGLGEARTPAPPPPPPPPSKPRPVTLSRQFTDMSTAQYVSQVKYPFNALKNELEGTGRILVRIDRQGNVLSWELRESTGHPILDREMKRVADKVKKLDPLPPDYPGDGAKLIIPFSFIIAR